MSYDHAKTLTQSLDTIDKYLKTGALKPEYYELAVEYRYYPDLVEQIIEANGHGFNIENVKAVLESDQPREGKLMQLQDMWESR